VTNHQGAGFVDRGIVISDGVVRRPRGYWSDAVHDLLRWLERADYPLSPRLVRLDEHFEYLTYLEGADQGWPLLPFIQSLEGARAAGAFTRQLESILAAYEPPDAALWQLPETLNAGDLIQHGDLGPWNLLWDSERGDICGLIDWDLSGPGPAGYDAGNLAWFMIPMMDDVRARERGFDTPIDRAGRLRAYCDGYGVTRGEMLALIGSSQEVLRNRILSASEDGPPTYAMLKTAGIAERISDDIMFTRQWMESMREHDPHGGQG
jgi:hypothetical protein